MSTTITSLLNSLHAHLQSQTQLFPTLHAQLGLPPTALADELGILQQQLTQCVEAQIDTRRKQVDEWMQKCSDVEEECIRYTKALGAHGKAAGSSVGEIRKEQVLPRRFEMISELHEKLRQLYHTKLEQLLTLTSRLTALGRILGSEFYPSEIAEPIHATGESEFDSTAHRDVTPERFSKLEKELVRGKTEVTKRLGQLSASMVQIDWLYTELGITPPAIQDLPSNYQTLGVSTITRPTSACSTGSQSNTSDPFLSTSVMYSTPTPVGNNPAPPYLFVTSDDTGTPPETEFERIFTRFVARMEELSDEELSESNTPTIGLEGVEPTVGLMMWAETKRVGLEDIKRRRETQIQSMYDQLEALWRRLGVSEGEMDAFVEAQRGSTESTMRAYEEELDRMLELKRERMSVFVENARAEITKLWDILMVGQEERADFAPFADDEHTEELLCIHEEEIRKLKEERKLKGPLLASVKKYFDICQDEQELAAAAADQTRLLGRGPRDPGRLLREEKMRKRVSKEKPRLKQDLLVSIPAWEAETGRTFLVHGESMFQILSNAPETTEKENGSRQSSKRSKSRSGSAPARSTTPTNPVHNFAPRPGSSHGGNNKTPAVRPPSRSRSVSSKRPRLGEATSTYNNVGHAQSGAAGHQGLGSSRGPGAQRAPSPTKPSGKTSSSSLPRPVAIVAPVPRRGTSQQPILGYGRVPSSQQKQQHGQSYHPYPQTQRSSSQVHVYGSAAFASSTSRPTAARKASRARRESFKPRPSVDEGWGRNTEGPTQRWPGFAAGTVTEDEGDF